MSDFSFLNDYPSSLNDEAGAFVVLLLSDLFGSIADIQPESVEFNLLIASADDYIAHTHRVMKHDWADFLVENVRIIYLDLITNPYLRSMLRDAINEEMVSAMNGMSYKIPVIGISDEDYVLDLSSYDASRYSHFSDKIRAEFSKSDKVQEEIDIRKQNISASDRIDIGDIVSDFTLLFMALSHSEDLQDFITMNVYNIKSLGGF